MSKVFVVALSLYCLLRDMTYKCTKFSQIHCNTQQHCQWELCAWCWLHICLIRGCSLVSFSLKSPRLVISSWFFLARSKSVTMLNPHTTKHDDKKLISFVVSKNSSDGIYFCIPRTAILWFLWKKFSRIHLAVIHIIPVGIALILQINLLKVLDSTNKGTPLLSSHETFHSSH